MELPEAAFCGIALLQSSIVGSPRPSAVNTNMILVQVCQSSDEAGIFFIFAADLQQNEENYDSRIKKV